MKKLFLLFFMNFLMVSPPCLAQWNMVHFDTLLTEVADVHFFNKDTGVVCGQIHHGLGFVLKTFNGGHTWIHSTSDLAICMSLFFLNDSVGFTGSQDMGIYQTFDGGMTWIPYNNFNPLFDYDGLHFFTDSVGIIKAYNGAILKTIDHGSTWAITGQTHLGYGSHFYERNVNPFYFINDSTGFVVGHGVFKTTDQGTSWVRQNADTSYYLRAITMKNALEGFAVGSGGVLMRTFDGGTNWNTDSISNQDLRDIVFPSNSTGYCVGGGFNYISDTTGILLSTTDGGNTWNTKKISSNRLNSIFIVDSTGYITGNYGKIFKYQDISIIPIDTIPVGSCDYQLVENQLTQTINVEGFYSDGRMIFSIYNILGNLILYEAPLRSPTIDISSLSSGIYIARHLSYCGSFTLKFAVVR